MMVPLVPAVRACDACHAYDDDARHAYYDDACHAYDDDASRDAPCGDCGACGARCAHASQMLHVDRDVLHGLEWKRANQKTKIPK